MYWGLATHNFFQVSDTSSIPILQEVPAHSGKEIVSFQNLSESRFSLALVGIIIQQSKMAICKYGPRSEFSQGISSAQDKGRKEWEYTTSFTIRDMIAGILKCLG